MKTNVRETSLKAFFKEVRKGLGKRQTKVLQVIAMNPDGLTNTEIADILDWPINTVTPRVYELRKDFEVVQEKERRLCSITGRKAITWIIRNN